LYTIKIAIDEPSLNKILFLQFDLLYAIYKKLANIYVGRINFHGKQMKIFRLFAI